MFENVHIKLYVNIFFKKIYKLNTILSDLLKKLPESEATDSMEDDFPEKLAATLRGNSPSIMEICIRSNSSRLTKLTQEESTKIEEYGIFSRKAVEKLVSAIRNQYDRNQSLNEALTGDNALKENKLAEENSKLIEANKQLRAENEKLQLSLAEAQRDVKGL